MKAIRTDRERIKITAHIQQTRDAANDKNALEIVEVCGRVNMALPIGEQSYGILKEKLYGKWEDDIVNEDEVVEEMPLEP